jgi:hypothetical protein
MAQVIVRTEDGRMLLMPRDEAEWVIGTAREHDALTFWLEGRPTMEGYATAPQPVMLPRVRCGLRRALT